MTGPCYHLVTRKLAVRTPVCLMLVSKDTFPCLFPHSIFTKIMAMFMIKFIKA